MNIYTAKPNGEETILPDKAFITGDLVSMTVDTGNKKLGLKLWGGTYGTLSPQIKSFTAKAGNHEITLNWQNPTHSNLTGLYLVCKQGTAPQKLSDVTKIDAGKATSYTDNEPENGKLYYYRAFTYNAKKTGANGAYWCSFIMSIAEQIAYLIRQSVITIDNVAPQYKSYV